MKRLFISLLVVFGLTVQMSQAARANPTFSVSAISVNPASVSIANGPATITASISVVSSNPINQARLPEPYFYQTSDVQGTRINGKWSLVSGTTTDGTYQATVTIPSVTLTGAWTVGCIAFYDTSGFSSTNGGYSGFFEVLSAADKAAADKAAADKAAADKAAADKAAADKAAADKAAADKAAADKAAADAFFMIQERGPVCFWYYPLLGKYLTDAVNIKKGLGVKQEYEANLKGLVNGLSMILSALSQPKTSDSVIFKKVSKASYVTRLKSEKEYFMKARVGLVEKNKLDTNSIIQHLTSLKTFAQPVCAVN